MTDRGNTEQFFKVLMPLCESTNRDRAVLEWDITRTYHDDGDNHCICGQSIKECNHIKNRLNGNIIPSPYTEGRMIGCICVEKFIPNLSFEMKRLRTNQERENKWRNYKKNAPEKLCYLCRGFNNRRTNLVVGQICVSCEKKTKNKVFYYKKIGQGLKYSCLYKMWFGKYNINFNNPYLVFEGQLIKATKFFQSQ